MKLPYQRRTVFARRAGPDQNDLNWQTLAQPTGRRPLFWRMMRVVALIAVVLMLLAIVVHVVRTIRA